jgi:hypothetical protein
MRVVQQPTFRVPQDSQTHSVIARDCEARARVQEEWEEFCKKHGGDRLLAGTNLSGITFDGEKRPPEGWTQCKENRIAYRPSLKGPLSEAAKEFKALPRKPNNIDYLQALGLDIHHLSGRYLTPGYIKKNGTWYMVADPGCPIPDDVMEVMGDEREAVLADKEIE